MRNVFLAELRRGWLLFLRYPSETVTGIVSLTAIFLALFLGARYIAGGGGAQFGTRLDGIIVNYLLWSLTIFALGDMGWTIQMEAQTGTLEQLYLSPYGPRRIFLLRAVADLFGQLVMITAVMGLILLITRRSLHFTVSIIPPLLTTILGTLGLGFVLGGLTLLFKRIQNVLQLTQFVVLFMIVVPIEGWHGWARILGACIPLAPSTALLRQIMVHGAPVTLGPLAVAVLNGLAYFYLGQALFLYADRMAKRRGLLGGY
ncbi:MAG TPA: ABC transporter permease [Armatimonadota bacterium]|jgi:ABC-2 type transport system permease protein